jgi:hypothetical protein
MPFGNPPFTPRLALSLIVLLVGPGRAQTAPDEEPPPAERSPFDEYLQELDFSRPTTLEGRVRLIDRAERAVWIDVDRRLEDRGSGNRVWRDVPGDLMLQLYPRDAAQFDLLLAYKPGARLQWVIQQDRDGRRLILSYRDPALPPRLPL